MTTKVLDFQKKREENIEKKRRGFERVLFQNFLGAYSVLDDEGTIYPITLVDISRDGCMFEIPWDGKTVSQYKDGDEITLKMYFTKHSFIPVVVNVKHSKPYVADNNEEYLRYGCEFDKSYPTFEVMESFINFMFQFAEHSSIDKGETRAFFI